MTLMFFLTSKRARFQKSVSRFVRHPVKFPKIPKISEIETAECILSRPIPCNKKIYKSVGAYNLKGKSIKQIS